MSTRHRPPAPGAPPGAAGSSDPSAEERGLPADIRRVGICLKPDQSEIADVVRDLVKRLTERGLESRGDGACASASGITASSRDELFDWADLLVVLGGDGTLLSVARSMGTRDVPILGINLGTLGFLTEVNVEEMIPALDRVLGGGAGIESRMRLEAVVRRNGTEVARYQALNDAVIAKSARSRMIDLETWADGLRVTTYHADGLIVSTPTGSTAYSLSAGGPVVQPVIGAFVLTPICPHSLNHRPIVMPADVNLEVIIHDRGGEASLTVDGQEWVDLDDGDRVEVHHSPHPVSLVSSPFHDRYEIMRTKLRWGER
ncbi:MAG: NAD(+)/NADH kinase [Myxococcota bacterium]